MKLKVFWEGNVKKCRKFPSLKNDPLMKPHMGTCCVVDMDTGHYVFMMIDFWNMISNDAKSVEFFVLRRLKDSPVLT